MRFRLRTLLLLIAAACITIVCGLAVWRAVIGQVGAQASGVTATAANKMLWPELQLPASATKVTYYVDFGGCEATLRIDEDAFLSWCEANGWTVEPLTSVIPFHIGILMPDDPRPVSNGYQYCPPSGTGVFDADTAQASFCVSTFP